MRYLLDEIGYPRKEFYESFIEEDYAKRIGKAGYHIYQIRYAPLLYRSIAEKRIKYKSGGKTYEIEKMSPEKWYYYMRNGLLTYPGDEEKDKQFRKEQGRRLLGVFITDPLSFPAALEGYIDGVRRVTGRKKRYILKQEDRKS